MCSSALAVAVHGGCALGYRAWMAFLIAPKRAMEGLVLSLSAGRPLDILGHVDGVKFQIGLALAKTRMRLKR